MLIKISKILSIFFVISLLFLSGCGGSSSTTAVTYSVTYDDNESTGGSVPVDSLGYENGETVTVRGNSGSLEKTGSYFAGWNTQADGAGTNYEAGETFTMGSADVTLYAHWDILYDLRDTGPAGGLIFYDKGFFSSGWRYLEAAPSDQSTGIEWYNGTFILTGADGTVVGTGQTNTTTIVTEQGDGDYAAQVCNDLEVGDYDDWFLPSVDELYHMYKNLAAQSVGDFTATYYWSSSETLEDFADTAFFGSGATNDVEKDNTYRVRAARAF